MIIVNLEKAKTIAHDMRRVARAEEFKPFDDAIAKQIPGQIDGAEEQRALIREKYVGIQIAMDAAKTVDHLKSLLP